MDIKIKTLAIDDEPLALQQLASYIKSTPFLELVGECQNAVEAQQVMKKTKIDAIFIDITMPDLNGLDFVRSLEERPLIVFTTAYSDYAIESYKVEAVDYLLKPFGLADLQQAAERVKRQYELLNKEVEEVALPNDDTLFLKNEHKVVRINVNEIRCIEGMGEYLKIHFDSERRPLIVLLSMKKMEENLPKNFMRIHRSWIINLLKIEEIIKNRVILGDNTNIPIGDMYRETFTKYIDSKFLEK